MPKREPIDVCSTLGPFCVLAAVVGCSGIPAPRLSDRSRVALTSPIAVADASVRAWVVDNGPETFQPFAPAPNQLWSFRPSTDPPASWEVHPLPAPERARPNGPAAFSWNDTASHERVFVATRSGKLFVLATDDGATGATFRWRTTTSNPGRLSGPVAAARLGNDVAVAFAIAASGGGSPQLSMSVAPLPHDDSYVQSLVGAPASGIAAGSPVAAAATSSSFCAFVRTVEGQIGVFPAPNVTDWVEFPVGTESSFASPAPLALSYEGTSYYNVFVVGASGEIHELSWAGCGVGAPEIADLGQPPGGSVRADGALSAVASSDGAIIDLFASSQNRKVYVKTLVHGEWSDWAPVAAPGDVLRAAGGLAAAPRAATGFASPHASWAVSHRFQRTCSTAT